MSFNVDDGVWFGELISTQPTAIPVHSGNITQFRSSASAPAYTYLQSSGLLAFQHTAMLSSHTGSSAGDWLSSEPELSIQVTQDGIYSISFNPGYIRLENFNFSSPVSGISLNSTFSWGAKAQIEVSRQPGDVYDYQIPNTQIFVADEQQLGL